MAVDEAEPGGSDRKVRVGGAESQIAGEREAKAAPDRDAADHGDGRRSDFSARRPSCTVSP